MAHPRMFAEDDRHLARVHAIALALPGAAMKVSHGRPAFFTTKVFAYFGGSRRVDGEWVEHPCSILVRPDDADHDALVDDARVYLPAYLGPSGWIGLELPALRARASAWGEVAELIDASYRRTAGKRLVAELDAQSASR